MAVAGTSLRAHCLSPSRVRAVIDATIHPPAYARMFSDLPAFEADEAFLRALGRAGGPCDCEDITDDPASVGEVAAGWPIFGQFIAHDITADRSALRSHVNAETLRNARTPRLDLECLYGDGPVGHPFLFARNDPATLLLGTDGADVPRNAEGIAIIGDPRNDSHMLLTQMHLAMLKAHNMFVTDARERGVPDREVFATAARELRWHYQSIIIDEFLPSLVGRPLVDEVLSEGARWFQPADDLFIPLEFADAAYRYGHSQIRQKYRLNSETDAVPIFPDLLGSQPVPRERAVDWTLLFDAPGAKPAQRTKKIDGRLSRSLIQLPLAITGVCEIHEYHSLAARDLQRGQAVGLPSGEAVARHLGVKPLSAAEVGLATIGWIGETPLWYYILREAAITTSGNRLGPIGARIVTEVILTLLTRDPGSVHFAPTGWEPRRSLIELLTGRPPLGAGRSPRADS
jgi:Animal haem peroxidase